MERMLSRGDPYSDPKNRLARKPGAAALNRDWGSSFQDAKSSAQGKQPLRTKSNSRSKQEDADSSSDDELNFLPSSPARRRASPPRLTQKIDGKIFTYGDEGVNRLKGMSFRKKSAGGVVPVAGPSSTKPAPHNVSGQDAPGSSQDSRSSNAPLRTRRGSPNHPSQQRRSQRLRSPTPTPTPAPAPKPSRPRPRPKRATVPDPPADLRKPKEIAAAARPKKKTTRRVVSSSDEEDAVASNPIDALSPLTEPNTPLKDRRLKARTEPFPELAPLSPQSPSKGKGKGKAREPFPEMSPLRTPPPEGARALRKEPTAPFPDLSPLALPKGRVKRAATTPFPMATQELESLKRAGPSRRPFTRDVPDEEIIDVDAEPETRIRDVDGSDDSDNPLELDASRLDINALFLDPNVDPSTLCPYCDEALPPSMTPHLISLLEDTKRRSYPDARPTNPLGRKAPFAAYIATCQRHRFEGRWLPRARRKGWPMRIDFARVRTRVEAQDAELRAIVEDRGTRTWLDDDEEEEERLARVDENAARALERKESARGPRDATVFWRDIMRDIKKKGTRAVAGVGGQFASFEKAQPGYFGEMGSMVIHQTLYNMFPPSEMDPTTIAPLTPPEFIQRILVPEAAVRMIMEDLNQNYKQAVKTLRESSKYGVAMFPDNNNVSTAGEAIVRERARARRREIEEEEGEEEAAATEEMDTRSDASGTRARKGKRKARPRAKESGTDVEAEAETPRTGARKPKRMRTPDDADLSTDEMWDLEATAAIGVPIAVKKPKPRPRPRKIGVAASASVDTIDLCSSSATESDAKPERRSKPKPRRLKARQEPSLDSEGPQPVPARAASRVRSVAAYAGDEEATPRPRRQTRQASRAQKGGPPSSRSSAAPSPRRRGTRLDKTSVPRDNAGWGRSMTQPMEVVETSRSRSPTPGWKRGKLPREDSHSWLLNDTTDSEAEPGSPEY